ncbi:hypothetical protein PMAYCL1PPCAC_30258, partial [Pristionchus mayeri]
SACGDDAITACVDGFDCEPSLFEDPPFTGCCVEATSPNPVNPVDPNNQGSNDGSTTSAVTRRAKSSPVVTHPAGVLTCRNSIDDAECEHNKKLCTNKYYVALMAQQCAATCGC